MSLVRIEDAGPDRRARRLVFDDGTIRTTSIHVIKAIAVSDGDSRSNDEIIGEVGAAELVCARDRAFAWLSYRERSVSELRRRLKADGYPPAVVDGVVSTCVTHGFVDDARFARMWVTARRASRYGDERIRRELADKGVADSIVIEALGMEDVDTVLDRARSQVRASDMVDRSSRQRAMSRLVRRGFSFDVARRALVDAEDTRDDADRLR